MSNDGGDRRAGHARSVRAPAPHTWRADERTPPQPGHAVPQTVTRRRRGHDTYPFDPYTDSQWKLAGSSGVPFHSVNYPTRYLRHYDYVLRLDANDGTSAFAQDATFHRVAGLADASWSSFRSHNHPTRYIRHSGYALRVGPVSTVMDRADATLSVGH